MRENPEISPPQERPIRQGALWTTDDYEALVRALLDGCDDTDVARTLSRTPGAVRSRARHLLDPDVRQPGKHLTVLRQILTDDPDYDWQTRVRRAAGEQGARYWDRADVDMLHRAWTERQPLPALAQALGATEQQVVRELLALEIATSTVEAVDRLGATPGGVVDLKARIAVDRANTSVWVLTLTGLIGKPDHHVSLHTTQDDAEQTRDRILNDLTKASTDTGAATVTWTIAQRTPGGENTGPGTSGHRLVHI